LIIFERSFKNKNKTKMKYVYIPLNNRVFAKKNFETLYCKKSVKKLIEQCHKEIG